MKAFSYTLNSLGPEAAAEYTTETPPFPRRSREQWIGSQKLFSRAFPDTHETFEMQSVKGNVVSGINRTTGTHTGGFDLSGMGIGIVPATGKSAQTVFFVTHVVEGGRIASTKGKPVDNMGLESVPSQLGIELPYRRFRIFCSLLMGCQWFDLGHPVKNTISPSWICLVRKKRL